MAHPLAIAASLLIRAINPTQDFLADPPEITVINNPLLPTDAGPCPSATYTARLCSYSALDDTFTRPGTQARTDFRTALAPYLRPAAVQYPAPLCSGSGGEFQLFTHQSMIQIRQSLLLALYRQYAHRPDFLPAGARALNPSLADQACPYTGPTQPADLKPALGFNVHTTTHAITLTIDNRYNPWRWDAPLNQVHHQEQPSFSFLAPLQPQAAAATAASLTAALQNRPTRHFLLRYDLTLTIADHRADMHEPTAAALTGFNPATGQDLFSTTARDLLRYTTEAVPGTREAEHLARYYATRYLAPSIQLSLAVNFQQDQARWRDAEFMLASKNYAPSSTTAFAPVSDPALLPLVPEGGDNGHAAWNRLNIAALAQSRVDQTNPALHPLPAPAAFAELPDGPSTTHLTGTIDLTDYYRYAIAARIFPGTSGAWNATPRSSIDPQTGTLLPTEHHQINSAGIVIEVHGPFTATLTIARLDVTQ